MASGPASATLRPPKRTRDAESMNSRKVMEPSPSASTSCITLSTDLQFISPSHVHPSQWPSERSSPFDNSSSLSKVPLPSRSRISKSSRAAAKSAGLRSSGRKVAECAASCTGPSRRQTRTSQANRTGARSSYRISKARAAGSACAMAAMPRSICRRREPSTKANCSSVQVRLSKMVRKRRACMEAVTPPLSTRDVFSPSSWASTVL
mmetsp:Transcript_46949/g.87773  ORF Transcript_46949/g.87773 Transcript_46949/m.87773 type:complete len:207 (+) Transcript_46949:246-866(+)